MKFFTSIYFIFLLVVPSITEEEKIPWSESDKLIWADFQGEPKRGSGYVASTNSGISFSYSFSYSEEKGDTDLNFSVASNFYPKLSWYIPSEVTENTLKHEQTHFDISELHARILRKKISEKRFSKNIEKEINALYKKIEVKRRGMQNLFDSETDHSNIRDKEIEWEAFVAKQLVEYERWK